MNLTRLSFDVRRAKKCGEVQHERKRVRLGSLSVRRAFCFPKQWKESESRHEKTPKQWA